MIRLEVRWGRDKDRGPCLHSRQNDASVVNTFTVASPSYVSRSFASLSRATVSEGWRPLTLVKNSTRTHPIDAAPCSRPGASNRPPQESAIALLDEFFSSNAMLPIAYNLKAATIVPGIYNGVQRP